MYFPLHCHSHYSLLDGLSKPSDIANRIKELGLEGCALTDHGTVSGAVAFVKAMKKKGLKAILGCEMYISKDEEGEKSRHANHLVVLAKNLKGWVNLITICSEANSEENFYYKPRLSLDQLAGLNEGNLIAFSGHLGSDLSETIFGENSRDAFSARTYDEAESLVAPDWLENTTNLAKKYLKIFGEGNFFLEIQLIDNVVTPAQTVVAKGLRYVSKQTGIPCVATPDAHYPKREDSDDQRVLLCSLLKTSMPKIKEKLANEEDVSLATFFKSDSYHIPSYEEMEGLHRKTELENSIKIADMCEDYEILSPPLLPPFDCELSPEEELREMCRKGWVIKVAGIIEKERQQTYSERVKKELDVLQGAGLSSYFLIVADIVRYIKEQGWLPGPGRGSAAGCLVSYLIGITSIDPIKYELIFERFYNAGRNSEGRVSMPDIDVDVPVSKRDKIIAYIKSKYGEENVAQMITYQTMMGRSAMKDVLRAAGGISFAEMNSITEHIPDMAEIADELQDMKEKTGDSSIILWALANRPDKLKEWCYLDESGVLQGPLSKKFEQAIRLEGTKRARSKHAAGIVISPRPLKTMCPLALDTKAKQTIAALEMQDMEDIGLIKFDILGIAMLDKMMGVQNILYEGEVVSELNS